MKMKATISFILLILLSLVGVFIYNNSQPNQESTATDKPSLLSNLLATKTYKDTTETEKSVSSTSYTIVDTDQGYCYDDQESTTCPEENQDYFGQDAQYLGNKTSYKDNGDGTVTDTVTGLMWQQDPRDKMTYSQAVSGASSFSLAGHNDWRLPTIKELYSLIHFRGNFKDDSSENAYSLEPFIDTDYFEFEYGDTSIGDRTIDSQWTTSSIYKSTVMNNTECFFGVNFADGRIKCYPTSNKKYFTIYVRGDSYGENNFTDNKDGTVSDIATGLMWQQDDNSKGVFWKKALNYCEDLNLASHSDWRLPNAKELHSIVDYSRSPDTSNSAAIDTVFKTSEITNEAKQKDYPFFWTSTSHFQYPDKTDSAVYVAFGRAMGNMNERWMDVHGAGAQRSDNKTGDPDDYPTGHGPQGDAKRFLNYVRCVRNGAIFTEVKGSAPYVKTKNSEPPQNPPERNQAENKKQAPPEAIKVCNGKSDGSSCSFSSPQVTIKGACRITPDNSLACVPN